MSGFKSVTKRVWIVAVLVVRCWTVVSGNFLQPRPIETGDRDDVLSVWRKADDLLVNLTETALQNVVPLASRFVIESEVENDCLVSLLKVLRGVKNQDDWAYQMLDASGKTFSGFYTSTVSTFGSFDQCVNIRVPDPYTKDKPQFTGQYCTVDFRILLPHKQRYNRANQIIEPFRNFTAKSSIVNRAITIAKYMYFMAMRFGLCVPSSCSKDDMNKMVKHLGDKVGMQAEINRCEVKEENIFDDSQIIVITVLSILGALVAIGTAIDVIPTYFKKKQSTTEYPLWRQLLLAFSLESNVTSWQDTERASEDSLSAIHGMKFLSMTWVIVGHSYLQINWQLIRNLDIARSEMRTFAFQAVINAYMSVDTFFFITGLLVSYVTLSIIDKLGKDKFNSAIFLVRRIWRLLPTTMMVIGLTILMPLMGSGPVWHDTVDIVVDNCRRNWWANLLFINNFFKGSEMCLPQTWYTATDMQLYCLALVFLLLLFRKPAFGVIYGVFLVVASIIVTGVINVVYDFPPTTLQSVQDPEEVVHHYDYTQFKPHSHASPYAIGLLIGYLLIIHKKKNFRIRHHVQFFLWLASIAMALSVLYGTYEWNRDKEYTTAESTLYASLFRTVWVLAVSWMTFACGTGRGGVINRMLSWKPLIPLSRLSFLAYLLHCLVIWIYFGNLRGTIDGHQMIAIWMMLANIAITFALAFVCHVLFEAPFSKIEKVVLSAIFSSKMKTQTDDIVNSAATPSPEESPKYFKEKDSNIVTIHTIHNKNQQLFNGIPVFAGYGRRLNDEVAKDAPEGRFQYIN